MLICRARRWTPRGPKTGVNALNETHWTIEYDCGIDHVPSSIQNDLSDQLQEIGRSLPEVHSASPFWESMRRSGLRLEIDEWEFGYRLDEQAERLVILYAVRRGNGSDGERRSR